MSDFEYRPADSDGWEPSPWLECLLAVLGGLAFLVGAAVLVRNLKPGE